MKDLISRLDAFDWGGVAAAGMMLVNLFTRGRQVGDVMLRVFASMHSLGPSLQSFYRDWTETPDQVRARHGFKLALVAPAAPAAPAAPVSDDKTGVK